MTTGIISDDVIVLLSIIIIIILSCYCAEGSAFVEVVVPCPSITHPEDIKSSNPVVQRSPPALSN
jgi:hypothetical protein